MDVKRTVGIVSLRVTHLHDVNKLSALLDGAAEELYATITVGGRFLGRTPIFSTLDGDVELPDLYGNVVVMTSSESVEVSVDFFRLPRPVPPPRPTPDFPTPEVRDTTPVTTPLGSYLYLLRHPWSSGTHRTQQSPLGAEITMQVATRCVDEPTSEPIVAARAIDQSPVRAKVGIRDIITARFVSVEGLHRPTTNYQQGVRNSVPAPDGYAGEDHLGRIFVHHDRSGARIREGQTISVKVAFDVLSPFPPGSEVMARFRIVDVDDPSDDRPDVASSFRGWLDPKDHNPLDEGPYGTPLGPRGHDNEGPPTQDPPWEAVSPYALLEASSVTALTIALPTDGGGTSYETEIVLHCPSMAGDRFILEVEPDVDGFECFLARSGVLTMWQRIDLQPYLLRTVFPFPLETVVRRLESAFFQVDVAETIPVEHDDTLEFTTDAYELADFFDSFDAHPGEAGWFGIVFFRHYRQLDKLDGHRVSIPYREDPKDEVFPAMLGGGKVSVPLPDPDSDPGPLSAFVDLDVALPYLMTMIDLEVEIAKPVKGAFPKPDFFRFDVAAVEVGEVSTRLWLEPQPLNPLFVAGRGALADIDPISFRVYPSFHRRYKSDVVAGAGYGIPEGEVLAKVSGKLPIDAVAEGGGIIGICAPRLIGGADYFSNVIFVVNDMTPDGEHFLDEWQLEETAQHELGHALGLPHRCGYVSAVAGPCPMQYAGDWSFTEPTFSDLHHYVGGAVEDRTYCPRHQREIRRTVLEDHPAYRWST